MNKIVIAVVLVLVLTVSAFGEDLLFATRRTGKEVDDFEVGGDAIAGNGPFGSQGIRLFALWEESANMMAAGVYRFYDIDSGVQSFALRLRYNLQIGKDRDEFEAGAKVNVLRHNGTYDGIPLDPDRQDDTLYFDSEPFLRNGAIEIRLVSSGAILDIASIDLKGFGYKTPIRAVEEDVESAQIAEENSYSVYHHFYPGRSYTRVYDNYGYIASYNVNVGWWTTPVFLGLRNLFVPPVVRIYSHYWRPRYVYANYQPHYVVVNVEPVVVYHFGRLPGVGAPRFRRRGSMMRRKNLLTSGGTQVLKTGYSGRYKSVRRSRGENNKVGAQLASAKRLANVQKDRSGVTRKITGGATRSSSTVFSRTKKSRRLPKGNTVDKRKTQVSAIFRTRQSHSGITTSRSRSSGVVPTKTRRKITQATRARSTSSGQSRKNVQILQRASRQSVKEVPIARRTTRTTRSTGRSSGSSVKRTQRTTPTRTAIRSVKRTPAKAHVSSNVKKEEEKKNSSKRRRR